MKSKEKRNIFFILKKNLTVNQKSRRSSMYTAYTTFFKMKMSLVLTLFRD